MLALILLLRILLMTTWRQTVLNSFSLNAVSCFVLAYPVSLFVLSFRPSHAVSLTVTSIIAISNSISISISISPSIFVSFSFISPSLCPSRSYSSPLTMCFFICEIHLNSSLLHPPPPIPATNMIFPLVVFTAAL
jgi:hypothetical protein